MNSTAKLEQTADHDGNLLPADMPVIQPEMARLLEFTQKNGTSVTPREINEHLARILQSYDDLTALYAQNNVRIDAELAEIRHAGGTVSGQLHQLDAEIQSTRGEFQEQLANAEEKSNLKLAALNASVATDVTRLGTGIDSLGELMATQERIISAQSSRLDQFDATYEILDTATRGNRNRIEVVREDAEKQHAVLTAQIHGLTALQREHYAEFNELQRFVDILQKETERLNATIQAVSENLATHVDNTHHRFKRTGAYLITLSLLTLAGFALVKWVPAFAPASTELAIAQSDKRIKEISGHILPGLKAATVEQEGKIGEIASQVARLEKGMGALRKSLLSTGVEKEISASTGLPLRDSQWLLQQNPKAYTVQILGVHSYDEMASFIVQNATLLQGDSLSYSLTQRDQLDRYNVFYGVFDNADMARAALDALPAELRASKPWIRQLRSVQDSLR